MRTIDADALLQCKFSNPIGYTAFSNLVKRQPTIDPERETGEWIPVDDREIPYGLLFKCSKCDTEVIVNDALEHKFCSECGARML